SLLVSLVLAVAVIVVAGRNEPEGSRPPITTENLAVSLTSEIGSGWLAESDGDWGACRPARTGWICDVADPGGSTLAVYEVRATSPSCWHARLTGYGERAPEATSGCVS